MTDCIRREDVLKALREYPVTKLKTAIRRLPALDVEPVVRCGDCKYLRIEPTAAICELFVYDSHYMICQHVKNARDFCSYGERKNDGID